MNIGQTIKQIRKNQNMKQKELASKSQVSQAYLSQIERNEKNPNMEILQRISKALEIPFPVLAFMSLNEQDVAESKRSIYNEVTPMLKAMVSKFFIEGEE